MFTGWAVDGKSPCGSQTVRSQCVSTDNLAIEELNLIDTTCTSNGFTCGDQKKYDKHNTEVCPSSMKNRFECPHTGSTFLSCFYLVFSCFDHIYIQKEFCVSYGS